MDTTQHARRGDSESPLDPTMHSRESVSDWGSALDFDEESFGGEVPVVSFGLQEGFSFDPFQASWIQGDSGDYTPWSDHEEEGEEQIIFTGGRYIFAADQHQVSSNDKVSNQEPVAGWERHQGKEEKALDGGKSAGGVDSPSRSLPGSTATRSTTTRFQDEEVSTQPTQQEHSTDDSNKGDEGTTCCLSRFFPRTATAWWLVCGILMLLLASFTLAALACSIGYCGKTSNSVAALTRTTSTNPTKPRVVTWSPTASPSKCPFASPSEAPSGSMAPTSAPTAFSYIDIVIAAGGTTISLPSYTLTALKDPTTPQYKALDWVMDSYSSTELAAMHEWRKQQLFAVVAIYYSLHGDDWHPDNRQNWLRASVNECHWNPLPIVAAKGPQITCELGRVSLLRLLFISSTPGLKSGTLPPEIELLSSLESLTVEESYLEGPLERVIPSQIVALSDTLQKLNLYSNRLNGTLPDYLWDLTALTELTLSRNALSGSLSTQMASLTNLHIFRLENNNLLNGTIPSELGVLVDLKEIEFGHSELEGHIPTELGLLKNLTSLGLYWNSLSGPIPSQLGILPLSKLYLHCNSFLTGQIPTDVGVLTSLTWLSIGSNSLSGKVPSELGLLSDSLVGLQMGFNNLLGDVPTELESLSRLIMFDIGGNNELSGGIDSDSVCARAQELNPLEADAYCEEPACWGGCDCLQC